MKPASSPTVSGRWSRSSSRTRPGHVGLPHSRSPARAGRRRMFNETGPTEPCRSSYRVNRSARVSSSASGLEQPSCANRSTLPPGGTSLLHRYTKRQIELSSRRRAIAISSSRAKRKGAEHLCSSTDSSAGLYDKGSDSANDRPWHDSSIQPAGLRSGPAA